MGLIEINRHPSLKDLRVFGAIWLPAGVLVASAWMLKWTGSVRFAATCAIVGIAISAVGFFVPPLLRRIYVGWMIAAYPIGWVISHLVLAVVFYLVITPIGIALRLLGRDPLARRFDPAATSYWTARDHAVDKSRYFKQF